MASLWLALVLCVHADSALGDVSQNVAKSSSVLGASIATESTAINEVTETRNTMIAALESVSSLDQLQGMSDDSLRKARRTMKNEEARNTMVAILKSESVYSLEQLQDMSDDALRIEADTLAARRAAAEVAASRTSEDGAARSTLIAALESVYSLEQLNQMSDGALREADEARKAEMTRLAAAAANRTPEEEEARNTMIAKLESVYNLKQLQEMSDGDLRDCIKGEERNGIISQVREKERRMHAEVYLSPCSRPPFRMFLTRYPPHSLFRLLSLSPRQRQHFRGSVSIAPDTAHRPQELSRTMLPQSCGS